MKIRKLISPRFSYRYSTNQTTEPNPVVPSKTLQHLQIELTELNQKLKEVRNAISSFRDSSSKRILFLGAGLSSTIALEYLCKHAEKEGFMVKVGDANFEKAESKIPVGFENKIIPFRFDISNTQQLNEEVKSSDLVVSLLPASLHPTLIEPCLQFEKHLLTASYTSDKMKLAHEAAASKHIIFLNEMGLDPGIDHMSCMQLINDIQNKSGEVKSFESFCGGLVAPESDTNPWGYKFSWNPRNVVVAGQGVSKFIQRGQLKFIPYHKLFSRTESISLPGIGDFDGYANRDSLKYRELYNLQHIPTFFRGTLRKRGFCKAWDIFVQLGLTDDSYIIEGSEHMTYRQFINSSMVYRKHDSVELKLCYHLGVSVDSREMYMLKWLGIFEERKIGIKNATPADCLLSLLERKWKMRPEDKDMVIMHNIIHYNDINGISRELKSTMKVIGNDSIRTAMAKTVGLPLAIGARLVLNGTINLTGVQIPTKKEIYEPVLAELAENDVKFDLVENAMHGDAYDE